MLEVAVLLRVVCRNEKENRIYRACSQHGCVLPSGGITVSWTCWYCPAVGWLVMALARILQWRMQSLGNHGLTFFCSFFLIHIDHQ